MPLSVFALPLSPNGPPSGYGWEERDASALSTTTAFHSVIDRRDIFLGQRRCIVCGMDQIVGLQHCHIIPQAELDLEAKDDPRHEPRDGLLMCPNHHTMFDLYRFLYVIYLMQSGKFVFINYLGARSLQGFHGKAVALDINDRYVPFPSIFIIHKMRVREFNPFQPIIPDIPDTILWQDWILSDGVFDKASKKFIRDRPPANNNEAGLGGSQLQLQPTTSAGGGGNTLELNADVINSILAATRAMPSWKACQMEVGHSRGSSTSAAVVTAASYGTRAESENKGDVCTKGELVGVTILSGGTNIAEAGAGNPPEDHVDNPDDEEYRSGASASPRLIWG
ncbi:hypothetical protein M422DRAFT_256754 [Sphaerobolus stellatus SS14]|uniref:HNH nuclease domain-containing protein n=1 Tax=Sphaerobolus stellatus (strain SS14) TaxID=990650 RepID=A0A0C9VRB6_SPHS4|nr:hypothetical protein M422DRAFT_256754 [Sphaerobolus stellatus SS14]